MRFIGIDVGSENHAVAGVDEQRALVLKSTFFGESAAGYAKLFNLLGDPRDVLVGMEATGHYWKNLFAALVTRGYSVAVINPLRTCRHAEEDLQRTKTDKLDARQIAVFVAEKRPEPTRLRDAESEDLRELVHFRERMEQDLGDRVRELHRALDLVFPEFTRHVRTLDSVLATTLLHAYPTAKAFQGASVKRLSKLRYGRFHVGEQLAHDLIEAAKQTVGHHQSSAYELEIRCFCEDICQMRERVRELDAQIERRIEDSELGKLFTSIDGVGPLTAARVLSRVGDPAEFRNAKALVSYLGLLPGLRKSGKNNRSQARLTPMGNAKLRAALWMPTLTAVQHNAWLRKYYTRLRDERGKPKKVAVVAAMRKLVIAMYTVAKTRKPFVVADEVAAAAA